MPRPFTSPLWRNGAFVRVWTAATISIFGSLITRMALPFVAILVLSAGPIEVAVLRSLDLVAALLVGLVAGAWVDRLRRRPVLIWADLGRALLLLSLPLAFVLGLLTLWQLFAVAILTAALTSFFDAADNAYLPSIVRQEELVEANSSLAASGSAAEFTAFGISGFLIQALTAPIAILIDAATFLVSALLLASIRRPEPAPPPLAERRPVLREIREGVAIVAGDPVLRALALAQMSQHVLWGVFGATYLLFAFQDLSLGPAAIGLIAGAGGFGSLLGALVVGGATRRWGIGRTAIAALVVAAVGNAFVPFAPAGMPLIAAGFLIAQQLVGDSAVTVYDITEQSVRQATVENRLLGRAASTFQVAAVGAQLVGTIGAGLVAEAFGLRIAAAIAPLGGLAGAVVLWFSPVRSLRIRSLETGAVPAAEVERPPDQPIGG
ncbi:MAG TPA: MFS transporter [Candidatus Limnocylindrales bacterium]|nr:MFS transporter [Candidatus Limnocylindrales bacterium]